MAHGVYFAMSVEISPLSIHRRNLK